MVVVVPLKPGIRDRVRKVLEQGPPFDPAGVGLARHQVFLGERDAVFVFEAASRSAFERLIATTDLYAACSAWHEFIAGPARLAPIAYSWTQSAALEGGVSFSATPGPGDSEGGDVFSPDDS